MDGWIQHNAGHDPAHQVQLSYLYGSRSDYTVFDALVQVYRRDDNIQSIATD